jgi:hypothetical protein
MQLLSEQLLMRYCTAQQQLRLQVLGKLRTCKEKELLIAMLCKLLCCVSTQLLKPEMHSKVWRT